MGMGCPGCFVLHLTVVRGPGLGLCVHGVGGDGSDHQQDPKHVERRGEHNSHPFSCSYRSEKGHSPWFKQNSSFQELTTQMVYTATQSNKTSMQTSTKDLFTQGSFNAHHHPGRDVIIVIIQQVTEAVKWPRTGAQSHVDELVALDKSSTCQSLSILICTLGEDQRQRGSVLCWGTVSPQQW